MRAVCITANFYDYTVRLANSLSKKATVLLMLPDNTPREYLDEVNKNTKLYLFKNIKTYSPLSILMFYRMMVGIQKFKPDMVHFQVDKPGFCLLLALLKFMKYPVVVTVHDVKAHIGEEKLITQIVLYAAINLADRVIVHGGKLKQEMMKEYDIPAEKIDITPIGEHEVQQFKKDRVRGIDEDENSILFFGRIYEYNGLRYLIEAEPIITAQIPDAKIIIAGVGEKFKKYEDMMVNRDKFIVYNRHISYREGAELFQRCSIVVLPYVDASQSGVIPVAYGFKKPVVTTDVGALSEIVDDRVTGFVVPPKNSGALADAIVKLLRDRSLRRRLGGNGYKKLKRDLCWDNIVRKTIDVYMKTGVVK